MADRWGQRRALTGAVGLWPDNPASVRLLERQVCPDVVLVVVRVEDERQPGRPNRLQVRFPGRSSALVGPGTYVLRVTVRNASMRCCRHEAMTSRSHLECLLHRCLLGGVDDRCLPGCIVLDEPDIVIAQGGNPAGIGAGGVSRACANNDTTEKPRH